MEEGGGYFFTHQGVSDRRSSLTLVPSDPEFSGLQNSSLLTASESCSPTIPRVRYNRWRQGMPCEGARPGICRSQLCNGEVALPSPGEQTLLQKSPTEY